LDRLRISLGGPHRFTERSALICAIRSHYFKRNPGDHYRRGDVPFMNTRWPTEANIAKQIRLAVKLGATRLRIYAWDWPLWKDQRRDAPTDGSVECQTGIHLTDPRWAGMVEVIRGVK
jgi:hypothetical protein